MNQPIESNALVLCSLSTRYATHRRRFARTPLGIDRQRERRFGVFVPEDVIVRSKLGGKIETVRLFFVRTYGQVSNTRHNRRRENVFVSSRCFAGFSFVH